MPFPYTFPLTLGPMQVLYPNIIYHPSSGTEIFIDSLQRVDHAADAEVVSYRSSVDGSLRSFTRDVGARQMSLSCKIRQENEQTMRRLLNYLRGEDVYLMLGAEDMTTTGKIESFNMSRSVGTHTPLAIEFKCDNDLDGQFYEAEDSRVTRHSSMSVFSDIRASGGEAIATSTQAAEMYFDITTSQYEMPVGNYYFFARVKDLNQISNDVILSVYNVTESTPVAGSSNTVGADYGLVFRDFSIIDTMVGDTLRFIVRKFTSNVNTIYCDYMGFVRV